MQLGSTKSNIAGEKLGGITWDFIYDHVLSQTIPVITEATTDELEPGTSQAEPETNTNSQASLIPDEEVQGVYEELPQKQKLQIQKDLNLIKELKEPGLLDGKLKNIAKKAQACLEQYQKFEKINPVLAKTALVTASLLMSGIAGGARGGLAGFLVGLGTGVANEARGQAINAAAGEYLNDIINKGIEKYSPYLTKLDATLTPAEAAFLGGVLLAATSNTVNFAAFAKNMKNVYFGGGATKDGKAGVAYLRKAERIDVGKGGTTTKPTGDTGKINRVYEGASYHTKKSNSVKSKAPADGKAALDNSVEVLDRNGKPRSRIGISNDEIVMFRKTHPGQEVYHGYVVKWSELKPNMRGFLEKNRLVDRKGRAINK